MGYYHMTLAWLALGEGRRPRWAQAEKAIRSLSDEDIWSSHDGEYLLNSEALHDEVSPGFERSWDEVCPEASSLAREKLSRQLDLVREEITADWGRLAARFTVGSHRVWATGDIEYSTVGDQQTPDEALELFIAIQALTIYGILDAAGFEARLH